MGGIPFVKQIRRLMVISKSSMCHPTSAGQVLIEPLCKIAMFSPHVVHLADNLE